MGCGCGGGGGRPTPLNTSGVPFTYRLHHPPAKEGMRAGMVDMYDIHRARDTRDALNQKRQVNQAPAKVVKTDTRTGFEIALTEEERKILEG